ncbi:MAG TPA: hypothetical protein ENL03_00650, partial [Phycisphaerae bacterium]|nr:hypothetical protein [Phycisphaerae bacterium]
MKHILVDFGRLELLGLSIPIRLYGYGLMLILGFILSIYIARRRARRMGESVEVLYNLGILALIGGIVGARLAYVIEKWDSEIAGVDNKLFAIFDISSGGLIYFGGLVLGAAFVFLFMVKKRLPVRRYIDIVAVSLMVGLAFGRLGCFTRGCCYGGKADAGWALSMEFPMYAEPYAKFDGRDNNPWPRGDRGTSPPYGEQMKNKEIQPDEHLFLVGSKVLVSQEDLHGELDRDQLVMFDMTREQIRQAGQEIAGPDGKIDYDDWSQALKTGEALTGSEHWNVGLYYDLDKDSLISVEEFVGYATDRNAKILKRFDRDRTGNGTLTTAERLEANKFLQADQISIARASHSHPVKPAQLLG